MMRCLHRNWLDEETVRSREVAHLFRIVVGEDHLTNRLFDQIKKRVVIYRAGRIDDP